MLNRSSILSSLGSAAMVLSLAACATAGTDYHRPNTGISVDPKANQGFLRANGPAFQQADPPDHWWRLYDDPLLDQLVEQSLAANLDLRAAEANIARAEAIVQQALSSRTISTAIGGGANLARPEGTGGNLPGILGYDGGIGLNLPLDLHGKIRRAIEAAESDREAVAAARDGVRVAVAAAATQSYMQVCAANYQLNAARRILATQRSTYDVTKRLADGGRGTAFDVTRAQTAVDQTAATLPQYQAQRDAGLFTLAALMGRAPSDFPQAAENCKNLPTLRQALPTGDGASLLRRRPDVRAAERELAANNARIGVVMADLYPQVSFGGSVGLTGPLKSLGSTDSFRIGLGPLISWSFPNRRLVRAQIAESEAITEASLAKFDAAVVNALREVETALSAYQSALVERSALQRARDSAATAENQAARLYRFGRADFLQLLTAQNSAAQAEMAYAASQVKITNRQVEIFRALGGGWAD